MSESMTVGQLRGRWLQQAILLIHDYDCARALDGSGGAEHKALLDHLAAHPDTPATVINCKVGGGSATRAAQPLPGPRRTMCDGGTPCPTPLECGAVARCRRQS